MLCISFFFFFQAEDGIRDADVTGVQTCALPIWALWLKSMETSGWVLTASTGDDSAARVTIALISSRVVLRPAVNTRSTRETRSEERRVGKECRSRWSTYH